MRSNNNVIAKTASSYFALLLSLMRIVPLLPLVVVLPSSLWGVHQLNWRLVHRKLLLTRLTLHRVVYLKLLHRLVDPQVFHLLAQLVLLITEIRVAKLLLAIKLVLRLVRVVRTAIHCFLLFGCLKDGRVVRYKLIFLVPKFLLFLVEILKRNFYRIVFEISF